MLLESIMSSIPTRNPNISIHYDPSVPSNSAINNSINLDSNHSTTPLHITNDKRNLNQDFINEYFDTADASDAGESPTFTDNDSDDEFDSDAYSPPSVPLYPFQNQVGGHASLLRFSPRAVCKPLNEHERNMYEHFEDFHPEILPFISSYLGVLNVTFTKVNDKVIPEVQFEKNKHIVPKNLLRKYLGPDNSISPVDSPGVTKANKQLKEEIFLEAYSPCYRKRSLRRKRIGGHKPRRRHSFDESIPESELSSSKSPLMRIKKSEVRLGSSFGERPTYDTSDDESSLVNLEVECLELPSQNLRITNSIKRTTSNDEDSVLFHMEDLESSLPNLTEEASHNFVEASRTPDLPNISSPILNPWSLEVYRSTMDKLSSSSSMNTVHQFLLLKDLTYNIKKPCVLDLKMGTRQYGIYATPEKRESQMKKCEKSTSKALGVRVCGMQIYKSKLDRYVYYDKYYGRKLSANSFRQSLIDYLHDGEKLLVHLLPSLISKLRQLFEIVRGLDGYRLYASSLLLIYDGEPKSSLHSNIDIKIIDFANCVHPAMHMEEYSQIGKDKRYPVPTYPPSTKGTDHGYLRGIATLLQEFAELWYLHASPEQQSKFHHEILVDNTYPDAY